MHKIGEKTSHNYWSWTHGPRGLLTTHLESAHGGGEALGDQSSLRQGVGTWSSGSPNLGVMAAVEQRGVPENGFRPESFWEEV